LQFNYLLNAASLYGIEQTRYGQRKIRESLDHLSDANMDSITVASPYLLQIIKKNYPNLKVKAGVFAVIDNVTKAKQWEAMGADAICISATGCNRKFDLLKAIRVSVKCECILIANALCLQSCPYELTHMNLLSNSSRKGDPSKGFCLDYCFLHCSRKRLLEPVNYIRSVWIRPEDLYIYQNLGFSSFKLVERSCPTDLILKRVKAYADRSFNGNLLELVGPVASIKKELNTPLCQWLKMIFTLFKPFKIKIKSLLLIKKFAEQVMIHDFEKENAGVYIDNRSLDRFIEGILDRDCSMQNCTNCGYCEKWTQKSVTIKKKYRDDTLKMAEQLNVGLLSGDLF
jgi:collagenase-like PrtC family protease